MGGLAFYDHLSNVYKTKLAVTLFLQEKTKVRRNFSNVLIVDLENFVSVTETVSNV